MLLFITIARLMAAGSIAALLFLTWRVDPLISTALAAFIGAAVMEGLASK